MYPESGENPRMANGINETCQKRSLLVSHPHPTLCAQRGALDASLGCLGLVPLSPKLSSLSTRGWGHRLPKAVLSLDLAGPLKYSFFCLVVTAQQSSLTG